MKRLSRKQWINFILCILWMILIFYMSAQDAVESSEMSHSVGAWIGEHLVPGFSVRDAAWQQSFADNIDFFVRKGAHASEYAVLAILWMRFCMAQADVVRGKLRNAGRKSKSFTDGAASVIKRQEVTDGKINIPKHQTPAEGKQPCRKKQTANFNRRSQSSSLKTAAAVLAICIFYAATDEFHQLFVSGRSGQLRDVCIDAAGAVIGICIYFLCRGIFRHVCSKS